MKFALCDDNPNELRQIRDYLLRYNAQANWKGFASSEELLAAFRRDYFDIVLLDIEMEGMNGYQAAEELNKLPDIPLIIFITQSGAYIIRGYEVAFRYLKKPVEYPDFVRAVSAAVAKCSPKSIPVAGERGPILVRIRDITYIEVFSYKTIIHTSKEQYQVRTPLKEFEGTLWGNGSGGILQTGNRPESLDTQHRNPSFHTVQHRSFYSWMMVLQPPFGLPDLNDIPGTPVYASMASLATGSPPGHSVFQRNIVHGTYTFADTTSHTTIFQGEVQVRATEKSIEQPFVQQIR